MHPLVGVLLGVLGAAFILLSLSIVVGNVCHGNKSWLDKE